MQRKGKKALLSTAGNRRAACPWPFMDAYIEGGDMPVIHRQRPAAGYAGRQSSDRRRSGSGWGVRARIKAAASDSRSRSRTAAVRAMSASSSSSCRVVISTFSDLYSSRLASNESMAACPGQRPPPAAVAWTAWLMKEVPPISCSRMSARAAARATFWAEVRALA